MVVVVVDVDLWCCGCGCCNTGTIHLIKLRKFSEVIDKLNRTSMHLNCTRAQAFNTRGFQVCASVAALEEAGLVSIGTRIEQIFVEGDISTPLGLRALAKLIEPYLYVGTQLVMMSRNDIITELWSSEANKDGNALRSGLSTTFANCVDTNMIAEACVAHRSNNNLVAKPFSRTVAVKENEKSYELNLFSIMSKKSNKILVMKTGVYKNFLGFK